MSRSQAGFLSSTAYMCGYMGDSDAALEDLLLAAEEGLELTGAEASGAAASWGSFICCFWSTRLQAMSCTIAKNCGHGSIVTEEGCAGLMYVGPLL